jgi:hypothetical protein
VDIYNCSEKPDEGCGALNTTFCSNNVCCDLTESGCNGACVTMFRCEECINGKVETCEGDSTCVVTGLVPQCVCGEEDPLVPQSLREPCPAGQTCLGGKCVPAGGECSQGLTAFTVQTDAPAPGVMTASAAQATVVCCDESKGEKPCGTSGDCCPPEQCNQSTGMCQDPGGGTCDPPCGQCEACEGGTCVPTVTCEAPQVLNPDTCQCEDPDSGTCDPPCGPCESCNPQTGRA